MDDLSEIERMRDDIARLARMAAKAQLTTLTYMLQIAHQEASALAAARRPQR